MSWVRDNRFGGHEEMGRKGDKWTVVHFPLKYSGSSEDGKKGKSGGVGHG